MNYMQYSPQQQYAAAPQAPRTQPYAPQSWNGRIRPVSSIEEVRASSIDFDGSIFFFPDFANKKIYTKQINLDGTASVLMYELKEIPTAEATNQVDVSNFITRNEFENALNQIKSILTPVQKTEIKEIPTPNIQF